MNYWKYHNQQSNLQIEQQFQLRIIVQIISFVQHIHIIQIHALIL